MPDIALYYPYTHVRDEAWLKAAALFWPKLAVVAPPGYPRHLSQVARVLQDELGFFVDVDPNRQARRVAEQFAEFIRREGAELCRRYAYLRDLPPGLEAGPPDTHWLSGNRYEVNGSDTRRVGWVHLFKMSTELAEAMVEGGLGVVGRDGWVGMHPRLADGYVTALAERLAQSNHMPAVTDRLSVYGVLNGWGVETLAQVLLADDDASRSPRRDPAEVAALYAAVAISTVVPRGLDDISVEQVVRARLALADEFDAFRSHVDSLADQFVEIAQVESPEVLRARLHILVERDLRAPTADLDRGLRRLGLEPARAVLGLKSLELPAVAAAAAAGLGVPAAVGQAGLVAAQVIASSVQARHTAQEQRRGAAGYLLGLREELDPQGLLDRLRRSLRRTGGRPPRRRIWWRPWRR